MMIACNIVKLLVESVELVVLGPKLGFLSFFLDIAPDCSFGQCLTSSWAETSKHKKIKKILWPKLGLKWSFLFYVFKRLLRRVCFSCCFFSSLIFTTVSWLFSLLIRLHFFMSPTVLLFCHILLFCVIVLRMLQMWKSFF